MQLRNFAASNQTPINQCWSAGVVMTPTSVFMYQKLDQKENEPIVENKNMIIEGKLDTPTLMMT
jgi:hypothetical protein